MSVPLTINGVTYQYPQTGDTNWGPVLTAWSTAVTNALKPLTGGVLTLKPFPNTGVNFANASNTGFLSLTVNGSNQLTFNGVPIGAAASLTNGHIFVGNVSNFPADVAMTGDVTITNTGVTSIGAGKIVDAQINTLAGISFSKLASTSPYFWYTANGAGVLSPIGVTSSSVVVTDANGLPTASTTTPTELNYVSGVTSSIQAQINALASLGSVPSGAMSDFAGTVAPSGWLVCDGSAISQTTYAALYAAIGTTWNTGGEGAGNFRVPAMARKVGVGSGGSGTGTLGNAVGNLGGEETHTLTIPEIPNHTHNPTLSDPGHKHLESIANGGGSGNISVQGVTGDSSGIVATVSTFTTTNTTGIVIGVGFTGGGGAHNNIQPSAIVLKIIKI